MNRSPRQHNHAVAPQLRGRRPHTIALMQRMARYREQGWTTYAIADKLGVTQAYVWKLLQEMKNTCACQFCQVPHISLCPQRPA